MSQATPCLPECPVARAARVIDGKWTTLIVRELLHSARSFTQLQRGVGSISPRLLAARLRMLEDEGVLTRTVHPTKPPTTEYALTAHGRRLEAVIDAMAVFGVVSQRRDSRVAAARPGVVTHRLR
jgi:DNA-binding HxlR family transcriptional regulator